MLAAVFDPGGPGARADSPRKNFFRFRTLPGPPAAREVFGTGLRPLAFRVSLQE
jgi:hypothetical protein